MRKHCSTASCWCTPKSLHHLQQQPTPIPSSLNLLHLSITTILLQSIVIIIIIVIIVIVIAITLIIIITTILIPTRRWVLLALLFPWNALATHVSHLSLQPPLPHHHHHHRCRLPTPLTRSLRRMWPRSACSRLCTSTWVHWNSIAMYVWPDVIRRYSTTPTTTMTIIITIMLTTLIVNTSLFPLKHYRWLLYHLKFHWLMHWEHWYQNNRFKYIVF